MPGINDELIRFFDRHAAVWDAAEKKNEEVIKDILDAARVLQGKSVLDVGCGTGILIPYYLERGITRLTAVDISERMIRRAKEKFGDTRIRFLCGDIVGFDDGEKYDCVMVHNAFPHFLEREKAVESLKRLTAPGGTLTVAHSISREKVEACHASVPEISLHLPETETLRRMFGDDFDCFTERSDEKMYIVSAVKRTEKDP